MRVLLLGGYGFIGVEIARTLLASGHTVIGSGRSPDIGRRLVPQLAWVGADMARLQSAADWRPLIQDVDVVVNAAGVLQDGLQDDVERVHHGAIAALVSACIDKGSIRVVQISAPNAHVEATSAFMRSKARGDAAIKMSGLDWVILRPGLVFGREAYGGSALLRATAAFPVVLPVAFADARVQTVALGDVAWVVRQAVEGRIPPHSDLDVVEDEAHALHEIIKRLRGWLGIRPAAAMVTVPRPIVRMVARGADLIGFLGWRPPLRTTAVRVLSEGIVGNPEPLRALQGTGLRALDQFLAETPSGAQERLHARSYLLVPLMVATLAMFWLLSGIIGLVEVDRAASTIATTYVGRETARSLVIGGAALDIALGLAILFRPLSRAACLGMALVSMLYLVAGAIVTPGLWLDPLGPFVKVVPAITLAVATALMIEER